MGIVYLCEDTKQENFPVALKTFKSEYLPDQNARERFMREAAIWVEIGWHPNIVQAFRVEYVTLTHDVYIVLEMVPILPEKKDPSLQSLLTSGKAISLEKTLELGLEISRGMKFATSKIPGLVHRDLKPENILLSPDGSAHITDFGIASVPANIIDRTGSFIPEDKHNTIGPLGTPHYMSPEQWLGQVVSPSSDIYSMGCIILEMLMGDLVIQGEDIKDLAEGHIKGKALHFSFR
jgi:serine/threonine protein kinase